MAYVKEQNKAAQIVTRSPPRFKRNLLYDKLDWLSVNQLIVYHTLISVYKIKISGEPNYIAQRLRKTNPYGRIILQKYHLDLAEKGFVNRGSRLWNSLPTRLRTADKMGIFKKEVRQWIKETVPRFLDQS